jgi:hypothetical protein
MFPSVIVGDHTIKVTDQYLARENVPGPVRRVLLEAKDSMQRAMRARGVDASA